MVETGQKRIRRVDFESQFGPRLPVEVVELSDLVSRVDPGFLAKPERPSFNLFMLMHEPLGSHTVDSADIPGSPGRLIQIRPGQIQAFNTTDGFDATLVLSQPAATTALPWFPGHVSYCDLDDDAVATAEAVINSLRRQQARFDGSPSSSRLMIALFDALVALYDNAAAHTNEPLFPDIYVAYRNAIETDLGHRHDVIHYARQLGYSARTISRACERATGQTAKQVLSERLVLEAKRLLVHTDNSAASVSAQLGFSEPTNFTKFFVRNTSQTPSEFRQLYRHSAGTLRGSPTN
ncbi:MAG: AraC family transcriptional regulator [Acidimicrobiia bacterium]|nr:AraC family transcriptional regulator [Acidimicrobiia bacterium]